MSATESSQRLTAVLRAAQYLCNLSPEQDTWAELAQTLRNFFGCDFLLLVADDENGKLRLVRTLLAPSLPVAEMLDQAGDEIRAVLASGFLGSQNLAAPACCLALLPLPGDRRTTNVAVIGRAGQQPFSKEECLLLDTELAEDQRQFAETIRSSGESLLALLNDILDLSKIEAGKLSLETLDFDLQALFADFGRMMSVPAVQKKLELICALAPDLPVLLRGDPGRLRQVLVNLTNNAMEFTSQGEVAVRVSLVRETASEVLLGFSVRDTGIGIPADRRAMLFQKFTQRVSEKLT